MVKVSAIVTTYNEERHVGRCIDSLISQDCEDYEVVVVDDGSKDGTVDIVENYVKKYLTKVRLVKLRKNLGLGNARNIGAFLPAAKSLFF